MKRIIVVAITTIMLCSPCIAQAETSEELSEDIDYYSSQLDKLQQQNNEYDTKIEEYYTIINNYSTQLYTLQYTMDNTSILIDEEENIAPDANALCIQIVNDSQLSNTPRQYKYNEIITDIVKDYQDVITYISDTQEKLLSDIQNMIEIKIDNESTISELSYIIDCKTDEYEIALAEEQKEAEEKARAEAEEAERIAKEEASKSVVLSTSSTSNILTKDKGVNYYNGHKETWYSERILPGNGLNIPGRYTDSNGIVRDGNGYICVASSDYSKGTIVETSLGTGKVYDCGCASGIIDIYTNW